MIIKSAVFHKSIVKIEDSPVTGFPEYAFIGRSNVGKSSLINLLTNQSSLARISVKPGKTQTINYFEINKSWYMVDLPGYGWAKVSKEKKLQWSRMVREYLTRRNELVNLFVLIDSRLNPQAIDIEFVNWAGTHNIPLSLVFTKSDKVNSNRLKLNKQEFLDTLSAYWSESPVTFTTSASDGRGKSEILDFIESINKNII